MDDKNLDRLFKNEKDKESMSPPTFVWDNLEQDLKTKSKRRPLFFWMFGIGFLLLVGGVFYFQDKETVDIQEKVTHNLDQENQISSPDIELQIEGEDDKINQIQPTSQRNSINTLKDKKSINQNSTEQEINNNSSSKRSSQTSEKKTFSTKEKKHDFNQLKENFRTGFHENSNASELFFNHEIQSNNDAKTASDIATSIDFPLTRNLFDLPKIEVMIKPLGMSKRNFSNRAISFLQSPKVAKSPQNYISAYINGGMPNFAQQAGENSLDTESNWYVVGLGLAFERALHKKLRIGIGINYKVAKRRFNYDSNDLYLIGSNESGFEYGKLLSQGEQKFRFIDIPLSIRYQILSRKIRVNAGVSLIANVNLSTAGKEIDQNGMISRYGKEDNVYNSSLGFGYAPFISLDYPIRNGVHLSFTPKYVSYFNDINNTQRNRFYDYSAISLDLGIVKLF